MEFLIADDAEFKRWVLGWLLMVALSPVGVGLGEMAECAAKIGKILLYQLYNLSSVFGLDVDTKSPCDIDGSETPDSPPCGAQTGHLGFLIWAGPLQSLFAILNAQDLQLLLLLQRPGSFELGRR
jgi:hypothetical protein